MRWYEAELEHQCVAARWAQRKLEEKDQHVERDQEIGHGRRAVSWSVVSNGYHALFVRCSPAGPGGKKSLLEAAPRAAERSTLFVAQPSVTEIQFAHCALSHGRRYGVDLRTRDAHHKYVKVMDGVL